MAPSMPHRGAVACGLAVAGLGFVVAGVQTGPGPRLVRGGAESAGVYLPPVIAGVVVLLLAAAVFSIRRRWATLAGGVVGAALVAGSLSVGFAGIAFRLTHPDDLFPFVADTAQLLGEVVAAGAAAALLCRSLRPRPTAVGME